jgi:hypothetical protein
MKISVFTSNQPRHLALIEALASIADEVFAVQECNTVFPGEVKDFFGATPVMKDYFLRVTAAERLIFGRPRFVRGNVHHLALKSGDLNRLEIDAFAPALDSDYCVVFGASFIKPPLIDRLIELRTVNIHMGTSPYYRGSSCNFWAMHDRRPDYVGATIHLLSKGLDSGPMLFHAFPAAGEEDGFILGMRAVRAAHLGLTESVKSGELFKMQPVVQDCALELRYTRNADFTDEVAAGYLANPMERSEISRLMRSRDMSRFLKPFIGKS